MARLKLMHPECSPGFLSGCKPYEINAFASWVMYHLSMDDRHKLMNDLPGVYNKLTGVQLTVTVGKEPGDG